MQLESDIYRFISVQMLWLPISNIRVSFSPLEIQHTTGHQIQSNGSATSATVVQMLRLKSINITDDFDAVETATIHNHK